MASRSLSLRDEFDNDKFVIGKGIALVITNTIFRGRVRNLWLPNRPGAQYDKTKILSFCRSFGFTYYNRDDLTAEEMIQVCESFSKTPFRIYDALLVFISSHGDEGNVIYGTDGNSITVNNVISKFRGIVSLANKPKLFFMQNCRSRNSDGGVDTVQADSPPTSPARIPIEADTLVAYSTVDGYESYRDVTEGSWFITVLMEVLNERDHGMNLTDLLSIVNKRVARLDNSDRKQMSCFESTLRKPVYFREREPGMSRITTTPDHRERRTLTRSITLDERQQGMHRTTTPNEREQIVSTTTASDQHGRSINRTSSSDQRERGMNGSSTPDHRERRMSTTSASDQHGRRMNRTSTLDQQVLGMTTTTTPDHRERRTLTRSISLDQRQRGMHRTAIPDERQQIVHTTTTSDQQGRRINRTSSSNQRERGMHGTTTPNERQQIVRTTTASDQHGRSINRTSTPNQRERSMNRSVTPKQL